MARVSALQAGGFRFESGGSYQTLLRKEKDMPEETVTIPASEYESLKEDRRKLEALEGAGVDNWEGYDYAMEILHGDD